MGYIVCPRSGPSSVGHAQYKKFGFIISLRYCTCILAYYELFHRLTSYLFWSVQSTVSPKHQGKDGWGKSKANSKPRMKPLTHKQRRSGHSVGITKARLYNSDHIKSHFYIVKPGFTWVFPLFFLFLLKNKDYGYSLEPPCWGGSNVYPQAMFLSRYMKTIKSFFI